MKHLGDITNINGFEAPIVDCVIGGSPCQDLSIAGTRAGLAGKRSGLFMEQIRIVKEMREHDRQANDHGGIFTRPRFMVWENVKGAFSSNGGEDFRAVLEETARIAQPDAVIPRLEKGQRWSRSGAILGDGWSIAWRLHDAQFWGVAQRRERIGLVADFGGHAAPEVLFERKDVSGNAQPIGQQGQGGAGTAIDGAGRADQGSVGIFTASGTNTNRTYSVGIVPSLITRAGTGGGNVPIIVEHHPSDARLRISSDGVVQTLRSRMGTGGGNVPIVLERKRVRQLSPLECERLQGFPDNWTDIGDWTDSQGKRHRTADSARYKALGNSIATPFWFWLLRRISANYVGAATMASLFDGIGGFPLCWERCNGVGTAIWASEIEEFPIAVTKKHFPEIDTPHG